MTRTLQAVLPEEHLRRLIRYVKCAEFDYYWDCIHAGEDTSQQPYESALMLETWLRDRERVASYNSEGSQ